MTGHVKKPALVHDILGRSDYAIISIFVNCAS